MTETFIKTIKLRFREPTVKKQEKIEEARRQSLIIASETAKRMPSLPMRYIKEPRAKGHPFSRLIQDLRNNGITLSQKCTQAIVDKIRASYLSMRKNHNYKGIPQFNSPCLELQKHCNIDEFFEKNGTYYVVLKLFPYEKLVLSFFSGDYQNYFLERIVNGNLDYGSGEIVKYSYGYSLNLSVKEPVNLNYEPKTFMGVDLGLNVLAWAVALDKDRDFLNETHFNGAEAGYVRRRYQKLRDKLNKAGLLGKEKEIGSKEHKWMENKNHVISRRIIEFAEQFEKPLIRLENINMNQLRKRADNPKIHSWTAGKLRNFIQYKAKEAEIKTELVNPKNTSRKCPKCGNISEENRKGIDFECTECGYTNHADFIGAWNIAE